INDGTGHFSDETAVRFPSVLLNSFGVGFGDVDGDGSIDLVFLDEGPNTFGAPGGKARLFMNDGTGHFTDSPGRMHAADRIGGHNGDDDNDVLFVDANDDGYLDVVVGSLGNNQEKLYLNNGTFAPGSFVYQTNGFTQIGDSTLDLTVGDLDNDGRYDIVTAQ